MAIALLTLAACTTPEGDLILRDGYRGLADPCRGLGTRFTNRPGDASPDIVACPPGNAVGFDARRIVPLGSENGYDVFYLVP